MPNKSDNCLNGGYPLKNNYTFCPECGQKSTSRQLSMKILMSDFLSNYFAFDSKLGRSIHHFFLRPGYLTKRFNEDQRVRYVHPLRLYLVISVFFFFLLSYLLTLQLEENSLQKMTQKDTGLKSLQKSNDSRQADSLAMVELMEVQRNNPVLFTPSDSISVAGNMGEDQTFKKILSLMGDESLTDEMVMNSLDFGAKTKANPKT